MLGLDPAVFDDPCQKQSEENINEDCLELVDLFDANVVTKSNRKAMNRNWSNQKPNPAFKTNMGNK